MPETGLYLIGVGLQIIEESDLPGLIAAHNLDDAAIKAVQSISK